MKRTAKILMTLAALAGLLGVFTYLTMAPTEVSCEVCIEFRGSTECRAASAKTREEAEMAAASTACSLISGGVGDSIACNNTEPKRVSCTGEN
jgi:hypothetical protein